MQAAVSLSTYCALEKNQIEWQGRIAFRTSGILRLVVRSPRYDRRPSDILNALVPAQNLLSASLIDDRGETYKKRES